MTITQFFRNPYLDEMYLIGYDLGSSSVKASIVDGQTGKAIATAQYPEQEMEMISLEEGWAEQEPEVWWQNILKVSDIVISKANIDPKEIKSIGIAYQMHGLVLVDSDKKVLRPSIIWCDSRAVEIGNKAIENIGQEKCLSHLLNSPGNFTASKLKWVKENESEVYSKIYKFMLPGDFIAMKFSGSINTTITGLSEGIMWDFKNESFADLVFDEYGIDKSFVPEIVDCFSIQANLSKDVASLTGMKEGTPVTYRAGDQPNNALSLGVFKPNEVAATGGTSGVVYGVVDQAKYDMQSRVNGFAHVNHRSSDPRIGLLLCINGAGIQYAWTKHQIGNGELGYSDMEALANSVPIGSDGLRIIPFGNGAERILCNLTTGAQVNNLQFNRHDQKHIYRASLEGIAFSFVYGFEVLKELGLNPSVIKVGNDNLFQSEIFSNTVANLLNSSIEVIDTNGATGAAKASGVAVGIFNSIEEAFSTLVKEKVYLPGIDVKEYREAFEIWKNDLLQLIKSRTTA